MSTATLERATERHMLDLLHARYGIDKGNGPGWACAEHVKSQAGHDAPRCADFIAMSLWPSTGLQLHGHEVKVSRSDWLRELAEPDKATPFLRYVDRWWLVVPDRAIVRDDLPAGWGLLVQRGGRLAVAVRAPALRPEPMPRHLLAPLLRATAATARRRALAAATPLTEPEEEEIG